MKRLLLCLLGLSLVASAAFAGVGYSGKEIKAGCSTALS